MRTWMWISITGLAALSTLVTLIFISPSSETTANYVTLEDARRDAFLDRGWLPDILPPSTYNIRASNNLDLNISDGSFSMHANDYPVFTAKLQPYKQIRSPFEKYAKSVQKMRQKGYTPFIFESKNYRWVFFCLPKEAYCEYDMWQSQT